MEKKVPIKVMLVGSGAVRAHPTRGGTCQLVSIGERTLMIDCGRLAVHNVSLFGVPVESIDEVLLTHLHFDHVCELPMMMLLSWNNGRKKKLPIYGPRGTRDFLEYGLKRAYADDIKSRLTQGKSFEHLDWTTTEVEEDGIVYRNEEYEVSAIATSHGGLANYSYRIDSQGRRIVITSDTEPDPRLIEFSKGADLLIVECSGTKAFYATQSWGGWHMTPESVGELAKEAGVATVVLKHLVVESFSEDPDISKKMAETVRKTFTDGEVIVGEDGLSFEY